MLSQQQVKNGINVIFADAQRPRFHEDYFKFWVCPLFVPMRAKISMPPDVIGR
jgi:hypothetical protein